MQTFLLLLFSAIISVSCLQGQTTEFSFVEGSSTDVVVDSTYDQFGNLELSSSIVKELKCELSDTSSIASIRVKLGTEVQGSDILNQSFDFDGEVISSSLSMTRIGIICNFTLGQLEARDFTFLKLEALSSSGSVLGTYNGMLQ